MKKEWNVTDHEDRLLSFLYQHRLLDFRQLFVLANEKTESTSRKRLNQLFKKGLVKRQVFFNDQNIRGRSSYQYFLTEKGLVRALHHLDIPFNVYENNKLLIKNHFEIKDLKVAKTQIDHHYYVQEWLADLNQGIKEQGGPEKLQSYVYSEARVHPHFAHESWIYRPDWVIDCLHNRSLVMLEMDMGTMHRKALTNKMQKFREWFQSVNSSTYDKYIILFSIAKLKSSARIKNIKQLVYQHLSDLLEDGRVEVHVGDHFTTTNWFIQNVLQTSIDSHNTLFDKAITKNHRDIEWFDFESVKDVYPKGVFCHRVIGSRDNQDKILHQINVVPNDSRTEYTLRKLQGDPGACFVLIYQTPELRNSEVLSDNYPQRLYSTDLYSLEKNGLDVLWTWTDRGWKERRDVQLL